MTWTKGRKQELGEGIVEMLQREGIDFDENILGDMLLLKLTIAELEELKKLIATLVSMRNKPDLKSDVS